MRGILIVAGCTVIGLIPDSIPAASFQIDALPAAAFDPVTFAPIPLTLDCGGNLIGNRPMVVQLDIGVLSYGYNPAHDERGFGAMTFNLDLFGSFSNAARPGWMANNPLIESELGSGNLSPRWDDNLDAGARGDLKHILLSNPVIPNPSPLDPRPLLTVGSPVKVGSVFVTWDGVGSGGIRVSPEEAAFLRSSDGKLAMFQPGEVSMLGESFHTPGWEPPAPSAPAAQAPPAATPSAPAAPPVTNPPPAVTPPAPSPAAPIVNPLLPVASPTIPVVMPAPAVPNESQTTPTTTPPLNPSPTAVQPQSPAAPVAIVIGSPSSPVMLPSGSDAIRIMPWFESVQYSPINDMSLLQGNVWIGTDYANVASIQLASVANFCAADFVPTQNLPEPSGLALAAIASTAWLTARWRLRPRGKKFVGAGQ